MRSSPFDATWPDDEPERGPAGPEAAAAAAPIDPSHSVPPGPPQAAVVPRPLEPPPLGSAPGRAATAAPAETGAASAGTAVLGPVATGQVLAMAGLVGGIIFAILAGRGVSQTGSSDGGVLTFALATILFVGSVARRGLGLECGPPPPPSMAPPTVERAPSMVARAIEALRPSAIILLAAAAWVSFGGNRFTLENVVLWLGAIILFLERFWEPPREGWRLWWARASRSLRVRPPGLTWTIATVAAVLLLGAFFRFSNLERTPAEMTSDHAEKLLDVWDVLHGERPIFFTRNTGREPLQFYFTAATVAVLGIPIDHLALKIGTALFGFTAVIWAILLGRQLFGTHVGLIAGALTAMSQWATAIDRVGLRFPFTAAFATPTLFFLVRALQGNRRNDWLLCGVFLGIGLHTYIAMRIVPFLVLALIGVKVVWDLIARHRHGAVDAHETTERWNPEASALTLTFWQNVAVAYGAMLLIFLPLARYMQESPSTFWYRVLTRAGEAERGVTGNPALVFLDNVKNAMLMFNYKGDQVPINTIPGSPVLDLVTGGLFVLGLGYVLWRLVTCRDRRAAYLLVMLFMLLLPSTLSLSFPGENPSVARTGGAIPVVMLIAALPLYLVARDLYETMRSGGRRRAAAAAVVVTVFILLSAARLNYSWYFVDYDARWRATAWNTTELGSVVREFVRSGGDLAHAYHVPWPHWADTRNIGINAGDPKWENSVDLSNPSGLERLRAQAADPARKIYLVNKDDTRALGLLQQTYPDGSARYVTSAREGRDFWIFTAPGRGTVPATARVP